ncbi:hypothetical protein H6F32_07320 [Anabaena sp. FACHB-1237]|uniref:hypothetical protein n=1 Tax=Anabaena sp. FACHB-1237 TaxID=2692769 RepID=UPI001680CA55|nr:hypothetical protein [Anabaena sp. FACHB-1237]MBD2137397.1 hypothetical protein [Anabaena sp. FACHB-1237]
MNIQERIRTSMVVQHQDIKKREQSMLMRTGQEFGLHKEIAQYWSPIQGKINPSIQSIYESSHVAMS